MGSLLSKFKIILAAFSLICAAILPQTAASAASGAVLGGSVDVTDIQYMLFSNLSYCELSGCEGETVAEIVDGTDVLKKSGRLWLKNSEAKIGNGDMLKKYVGEWTVDEVFVNESSGFFACTYKNEDLKQIVLAFRGTSDALGKDGINDAEFGLISIDAPQINDTLELTKDYILSNSDYTFSSTGHSLGGALATEIAQYYGWHGETFNAAQMTGTLYYDNAPVFGKVYRGFDYWQTIDHVNEHDFIVGSFEYGLFKNAIKHQNRNTGDKFFSHSVAHMLDIDEKNESIELSAEKGKSVVSGSQSVLTVTNIDGAVLLGDSKAGMLTSPGAHGGLDTLYGGDGDDYLESGDGNDVLVGGRGDDIIDGSAGNDSYFYFEGDGTDTVVDCGGHDKLTLYADGDAALKEEDGFIFITLDGKPAVKLDKAARADGYRGMPDGAKVTESYFTFDLEQIKSDGTKITFEIKSEDGSEIVPVYTLSCSAENISVSDKNGVIYDSKTGEKVFSRQDTGVYRFEEESGADFFRVYTKNGDITVKAESLDGAENIFLTKSAENDTLSVYAANIDSEAAEINVGAQSPAVIIGSGKIPLSLLPYSDALYTELDKSMLFTVVNGKYTFGVSALGKNINSGKAQWSVTDSDVAEIDENGNLTAKSAGQTAVKASYGGFTAICRVYVLSGLTVVLAVIAAFIAAVLLFLIIVFIVKAIVKHRKKLRKKRAAVRGITA